MSTIVSPSVCLSFLICDLSREKAEASNKVHFTLAKRYINLGLLFKPSLVCVVPTQEKNFCIFQGPLTLKKLGWNMEIKIIAGSFLALSIICRLRRKCRDWVTQYVKNVTDNEDQRALKLNLRCVEHEDFPVALPQKEPQTVLDFSHLFFPEDRRKGRHRLYTLTAKRPFKCIETLAMHEVIWKTEVHRWPVYDSSRVWNRVFHRLNTCALLDPDSLGVN